MYIGIVSRMVRNTVPHLRKDLFGFLFGKKKRVDPIGRDP